MIDVQTRTVSEYLIEQLAIWGIERIYGVAGDAILPWLDALGKQSRIRFVPCRHESAAAMMASAEAKLSGNPAVCTATSGPGLLNLLNGLADAQMDRVPVIAIAGQVETHKLGGGYKQYVQQEGLLSPISHYTTTVVSQNAVGSVLHHAFVMAMQRRGVAHLAICKDVFSKLTSLPLVRNLPRAFAPVRADRMELEQAADLLLQAKKPLLLIGNGTRRAAAQVTRLAETLGAAILSTLGAKGVVAESHPQMIGGWGEGGSRSSLQALAEADLLVILAATWFPRSFIPSGMKIVQVDANPEAFHFYPQLLPVFANLDETLAFWLKRLETHQPDKAWLKRVGQLHQDFWQETEERALQAAEEPVRPETLLARLAGHLKEDAIVALDTGEHTLWFNRAFRARQQYPLFSGKWRTMGYALPAAIAAKLLYPERQVAAVIGDGGLLMNLGELVTLVQLGLSLKIIVINNGSLGLEEVKMTEAGMAPFGTRLQNPDFLQLAASFGIRGYRADSAKQLEETLRQAFADEAAAFVEVTCTRPTLTNLKQEIFFHTQA
jgi:pyruvate dehydrogenase (quinone)/pyruvate oxidase